MTDEKKPVEDKVSEPVEKKEEVATDKKPESTETKKEEKKEEKEEEKQELPDLRPGYTIRLHQKVQEGEKERIQIFEGMIIAMKGKTPETKTITVRKVASGIGVEKIFPTASPTITKIEIVKTAKVRRAKLYFTRLYKKKMKETLVK